MVVVEVVSLSLNKYLPQLLKYVVDSRRVCAEVPV